MLLSIPTLPIMLSGSSVSPTLPTLSAFTQQYLHNSADAAQRRRCTMHILSSKTHAHPCNQCTCNEKLRMHVWAEHSAHISSFPPPVTRLHSRCQRAHILCTFCLKTLQGFSNIMQTSSNVFRRYFNLQSCAHSVAYSILHQPHTTLHQYSLLLIKYAWNRGCSGRFSSSATKC